MASTLKVDNIVGTSGSTAPITLSADTATLGTGTTIASGVTFPAGCVIQVVGSDKSDTASVSSSTWTDIAGTDNAGSGSIFCCKITPRSASSKILVSGTFNMGQQDGNNAGALRFLRDSTVIGVGDAAGNRTRAFIHLYLQNAGHHMTSVSPNF